MDRILYDAFSKYYEALGATGYMSRAESEKLLVLSFYKDFIYNDYRGNIKESDYQWIEKALNCIYGTSCLIPYPEYLKMGKMYIGSVSEIAQRVKTVEDTQVLKLMANAEGSEDIDSDIEIIVREPSE